jgi:hypothetical protein
MKRHKEETIAHRKGVHGKTIYDYVQLWFAVTLSGLFFVLDYYGNHTGLFPFFAAWQLGSGLYGVIWIYRYERQTGIRIP